MSFTNRIGHIISHTATPMALVALAQKYQSRFAPLTPSSILYAGALGCVNGILLSMINDTFKEETNDRRFVSGLSVALISGIFAGMFDPANQFLTKVDRYNVTKITLVSALVLAFLLEPSKRKKQQVTPVVDNRDPQIIERERQAHIEYLAGNHLGSGLIEAEGEYLEANKKHAENIVRFNTYTHEAEITKSKLEDLNKACEEREDVVEYFIKYDTLAEEYRAKAELSIKKLEKAKEKYQSLYDQLNGKKIDQDNSHNEQQEVSLSDREQVLAHDSPLKHQRISYLDSDEKSETASVGQRSLDGRSSLNNSASPAQSINKETESSGV